MAENLPSVSGPLKVKGCFSVYYTVHIFRLFSLYLPVQISGYIYFIGSISLVIMSKTEPCTNLHVTKEILVHLCKWCTIFTLNI